MPPCEKKISTENGVLQCDQAAGHKGMHSATHEGGRIPYPDQHKNKDGDLVFQEAEPLLIQWPQEGDNSPVIMKKG